MSKNFAIIGAAGYIAPRHLKAIRDTGNTLVAATDPHDSVGRLDAFSLDARFFPEIERFDRHLEKLRRGPEGGRVHYITICSPNYLHDAHIRLALRVGAHAICEKPLVINPWNLDALEALEQETGCSIRTILQLRVHPNLVALHERLGQGNDGKRHQVTLTYVAGRGAWYHVSWKGVLERSGGLATNIGVHLFDALLWLFGDVRRSDVYHREDRKISGYLELERADVRWYLSVDASDLPFTPQPGRDLTHRSMTVDGQEVEFTTGFTDLHTRVYEEILAGRGHGIQASRPSIELCHRIRTAALDSPGSFVHPLVEKTGSASA